VLYKSSQGPHIRDIYLNCCVGCTKMVSSSSCAAQQECCCFCADDGQGCRVWGGVSTGPDILVRAGGLKAFAPVSSFHVVSLIACSVPLQRGSNGSSSVQAGTAGGRSARLSLRLRSRGSLKQQPKQQVLRCLIWLQGPVQLMWEHAPCWDGR
jgi:hypothetical protein